MRKIRRTICSAFLCTILVMACVFNTSALETQNLSEGTYSIDASLSCYVNAMGGVEFGAPLLTGSSIKVDAGGNKTMTLNFTKSSVTIYNITCDTFIDVNPSSSDNSRGVPSGTIGYYDNNGNVQNAEYTLSSDTALNARDEQVHYVESMMFPVDQISDNYNLTMYINSNVMGVQFCNKNSNATETTYSAILTVDWNSLKTGGISSGKEEQFETLPKETKQAQVSTEVVVEGEKDDNTVEKDGLNIHYANGEGENTDKTSVQYTAYLNMPLLWVMLSTSAAVIIVGVVLIISSKNRRKQGNK